MAYKHSIPQGTTECTKFIFGDASGFVKMDLDFGIDEIERHQQYGDTIAIDLAVSLNVI